MLFAPAPAGGLTTSGKPTSAANSMRVGRGAGQPVPRARHARGPQHRLHLRLVAEVAGRDRVHAGDAEVLADLGEGHLQLLQDGQQPLHLAELADSPCTAPAIWPASSGSSIRQCPARLLPQPGRQPVLRARR